MSVLTASRKKKTIVYVIFVAVLVFAVIQVTYFHEAYSPLQVLSDARSEARRLLKFITLYHYQCNNTIQWVNASHWPVCLEKVAGLNLVLGGPRIMYSVGPVYDYPLERVLSQNFSYTVNVFHNEPLTLDFLHATRNKTHTYKTSIVPNDPADFGRNSYQSSTLNSIFESLKHSSIDILKIESLPDHAHSHEVLYFMVKDHLLKKVRQLHLALYVDKVDDDYLYSWYRALYMLFHNEGYRLYHSGASDTLCLQVTLMESCIYYLSWIRDPGPQTFILYPPSIDGSDHFELERLLDYVADTDTSCKHDLQLTLPVATELNLCLDSVLKNLDKACQLVILRSDKVKGSITAIPNSKCTVTTLEVETVRGAELMFNVKHRRYERSPSSPMALEEAMDKFLSFTHVNILYIDLSDGQWALLTHILDNGVLYNVEQLILDIRDLWGDGQALNIRRKYSELQRVEAFGFRKYKINEHMTDSKLKFHKKLVPSSSQNSYKLNYLKTTPGRQ